MFVPFVAAIIILFWIYTRYKVSYWKRRGVESLPAHPIFGNFKNALFFRSAPGWHLGQLHLAARSDAPFVGFYILHKPCLLLRDPDIIKQVMIHDFHNFTDRHFAGPRQRDSYGMRNLFGVRNPVWKYLRTKMTPILTRNKLKQMLPLMLEVGKPMIGYLKDCPVDRDNVKLVDAQDIGHKYTADLIASIAFGTKTDSFNYPDTEFSAAVHNFFYGFRRMITLLAVYFVPELVDMFGTRIFVNSPVVKKLFWEAMENREKTGEKRGDLIDSLLQLKHGEQNPDFKFEGDNLLDQSGTFFGLESSSTCVSFTLMELAKHPEYQELARESINRSIDTHGWTYEAFQDMKYLDQTIAECLRMYPPVTTMDRYAFQDYKIPGTDIVIEKGTPVYVSLYGFGEDPRFWDEPKVYNPDRFAENKDVTDAYMPFGMGPRMCLGMKMAQLNIKVVLALILQYYEVWQSKEHEIFLDPRSTFPAAGNGINLHFRKIIQ